MATKAQLEIRDALRLLAPGPVALVSTMYRDHPNLMTAGWLRSLSGDPTFIGVAIQPSRLTHEYITKTEQFVINIPNVDLITAVHVSGLKSGREGDKFLMAGVTPVDSTGLETPWVSECVAHIECGLVDRATIGDHDLFIGNVLSVSADPEAFDGVWRVDSDAGRVLHHLGADNYAGLETAYRASMPEEE